MSHYLGPWLTHPLTDGLLAARNAGATDYSGSFDLGRSTTTVELNADGWLYRGRRYPWPDAARPNGTRPDPIKPRAIYVWDEPAFVPLQRYAGALIKLVPTDWGAPTFEIDGIKMLPTAQISPYADAQRKVALVQPRGRQILDTCGGLGYFAACCLAEGAARIHSVEKNASVLWLRQHNPWSPDADAEEAGGRLQLEHADIAESITCLPSASFDAALHDPPRFGIAGELYAQTFYDQLARVLRPNAPLFHYTGTPNAKTSGRDVPGEVSKRLTKSGFSTQRVLDGVLAVKGAAPSTLRR